MIFPLLFGESTAMMSLPFKLDSARADDDMGYRSEQLTTGRARSTLAIYITLTLPLNCINLSLNYIQLHSFILNSIVLMSLNEVWEAASATPFIPLIAKDSQFSVGFNLLLLGKLLSLPQL